MSTLYPVTLTTLYSNWDAFTLNEQMYLNSLQWSIDRLYPCSRLLCEGGGKRAWYTLFVHVPSPFGNLYFVTLNLRSISVYLLKGYTVWGYTSCGTHTSGFEVKHNIALTVIWAALLRLRWLVNFRGKGLCHSRAAELNWNGRPHEQLLQAMSWVPLLLPRHRLHRAWSVAGIFYTREVGVPHGG